MSYKAYIQADAKRLAIKAIENGDVDPMTVLRLVQDPHIFENYYRLNGITTFVMAMRDRSMSSEDLPTLQEIRARLLKT